MKKHVLTIASTVMSLMLSLTAFAGSWKNNAEGWWYDYGDGTCPVSSWEWLDGNNDGIAECYYFDQNGYMVADTTLDGYMLNADGQWVSDGVVQTKVLEAAAVNNTSTVSESKENSVNISLFDIKYVDKYSVDKHEYRETKNHELWSKCFMFEDYKSHITYYLDGKYNSLTFSYAPYFTYDEKDYCTMCIYGDNDRLLWKSDTILSTDITKTVTVDISGQDEVRIQTNSDDNGFTYVLVKGLTLSSTAAVNSTSSNSNDTSYIVKTKQSTKKSSLLYMEPVYHHDVETVTNAKTMRDESWPNCLKLVYGSTVVYTLDSQYDSLTFSYAPKKGFGVEKNSTIYMYGDDDTILWKSDEITSKDKTKTATVNISGQNEIRIHMIINNNSSGDSVLLKDLTLS